MLQNSFVANILYVMLDIYVLSKLTKCIIWLFPLLILLLHLFETRMQVESVTLPLVTSSAKQCGKH